jgi:hypothetical protein
MVAQIYTQTASIHYDHSPMTMQKAPNPDPRIIRLNGNWTRIAPSGSVGRGFDAVG